MIKWNQKATVPVTLAAIAMVLIVVQLLSTGAAGETDSISHFQLARYAFKYPASFLNHWGKPLFTILLAPMAQFGYTGAIAFNLLCGLLSGWLVYKTARELGMRHAWGGMVFTVFTPIYLFNMYSSLTEILFSLVLILAIYLFVSKRFIWSAVIISLLPFARTEGVMFLVLFIPALAWVRQWRALPFLLTGFLGFSLAGLPQYHDFFWFITKMPYSTDSALLYGKGSFWTYFNDLDYILNFPLLILVIAGILVTLAGLKDAKKQIRDIRFVAIWVLVIPGLFGFLLAQSYLWWKGLGILASQRFMSCVVPLGALLAVAGFNQVMDMARQWRIVHLLTGVFIIALVAYKPFTYNVVPTKTGINFAVMEKAAEWLKSTPYAGKKALYSDPMYPFYMDSDPFNKELNYRVYSFGEVDPPSWLEDGELLIWDTHFAGYEGHLPFDTIMKDPEMRLINIFTPLESFTVIGGQKYKVAIFMKAPRDSTRSSWYPFRQLDTECTLSPQALYSPGFNGKLTELPGTSTVAIRASTRVMYPEKEEQGQVNVVISIEDAKKVMYRYILGKDSKTDIKPGEWYTVEASEVIDRRVPEGGTYKVYVWFTGKGSVKVEGLKVECCPIAY